MPEAPDVAVCEAIVTAPSVDQLRAVTVTLITESLVACGHHFEAVSSIYRWGNEVFDKLEARVEVHTRSTLVTAISNRVKQLHPYEVPCIAAVPFSAVSQDYREWILAQTRRAP